MLPAAPATVSSIPSRGYVMRGGREMGNPFRMSLGSVPQHSLPWKSPALPCWMSLDWLNKHDPNYSLCRATKERGKDAHTDGRFNLSQKGCMEIMKLFMTKDEDSLV